MAHQRIVRDPKVMMGKPTVRGTRIAVEQILSKLGAGVPIAEILAAHPRLTPEDIQAAQAFAADFLADGHDAAFAAELHAAASDAEILRIAVAEGRILVTEDKDFGRLCSPKASPRRRRPFCSGSTRRTLRGRRLGCGHCSLRTLTN